MATVNVGSMVGKASEIAVMLERRKIDFCCVQEVRFKREGTKFVGENQRYKFWWSGGEEKRNGVGILLKEELVENVINIERYGDRIMKVVLVMGGRLVHIFSLYAPQQGRPEEEKRQFRESLEDKLAEVPVEDVVLIGGDMNAHVGYERDGYEVELGCFGLGERNREGEELLRICQENSLKIVNTWFQKRREHLITYKSGECESQIDYVLLRKRQGIRVKDCKVIPGEECLTQHRLLCCDLLTKNVRLKTHKREKRIKQWKLKNDQRRREFEERLREKIEENEGWTEFSDKMMEAAREVCGESKGKKHRERITWWWCEDVQEAIKQKKTDYKIWQRERTEITKRAYKNSSRRTKRAVAIAKNCAWTDWSQNIDTAEGKQKMFKIAKQVKKERKDVVGARYIKDEAGHIKVKDTDILQRWRRYFNELLNEENHHELEQHPKVEGPIIGVTEKEIRDALKSMKSGKAAGPSGLTADILRAAGETGLRELNKIFEKMEAEESAPREWGSSYTIPVYKGKGDSLLCGKYRGVRLLEHGMKLWEKVLEKRLRNIVNIDEKQFGFQPGRSTTDAIFVIRQLQEKYIAKKRRLYHVFVDLEKAFDRVPRKVIKWALRRQGVPERLIRLVMALYKNSKSKVKTSVGTSEEFNIGVGVHQGSALSPLLFILVIQEATKEVGREGLMELLYADDLVLMAESQDEVVERFEAWKGSMERRGLKVNMDKTKVLISGKEPRRVMERGRYPCSCCGKGVGGSSVRCVACKKWCHRRCSGLRNVQGAGDEFRCPKCVEGRDQNEDLQQIRAGTAQVEIVDSFCYLGDVLRCEGGAEAAVRARIACAWKSWRELASILVNQSIPFKARAQVYRACVRSVLLYGSETWATTQQLEDLITRCDTRMLRYMLGIRWQDEVPNEVVRSRSGLPGVDELMRRSRLRWFGHVTRREEDNYLRRALAYEAEGRRPAGRPKKTWKGVLESDMSLFNITEEMALNRPQWKLLINRPTPNRENVT